MYLVINLCFFSLKSIEERSQKAGASQQPVLHQGLAILSEGSSPHSSQGLHFVTEQSVPHCCSNPKSLISMTRSPCFQLVCTPNHHLGPTLCHFSAAQTHLLIKQTSLCLSLSLATVPHTMTGSDTGAVECHWAAAAPRWKHFISECIKHTVWACFYWIRPFEQIWSR